MHDENNANELWFKNALKFFVSGDLNKAVEELVNVITEQEIEQQNDNGVHDLTD